MRRRGGPTVSLFPFLTVLLCASGTLIVLLIALSQHVRDDAAAVAEAQSEPEPEMIEPEPAPPPTPRSPRVIVRASREPDLRPAWRAKRDAAEAEADRLAAMRDRAETAVRAAGGRTSGGEVEENRLRLALRSAIREREDAADRVAAVEAKTRRLHAEAASLKARAESAAAAPPAAASLLPIVRTAGGADVAAPILVECTAAGATFRPAGVTLPPFLIPPSADRSSPLSAGVRVLADAGDSGEEYVLLLVRPDGLAAFYDAAAALDAAGLRYGYELLDADARVAWGEADADRRAALIAAVERAAVVIVARGRRSPGAGAGAGGGDGFGDGPAGVRGGGFSGTGETGRGAGAGRGPGGRGDRRLAGGPRGPAGGASGSVPNGTGGRSRRGAIPGFTPGTPADRLSVGAAVRGDAANPGGRAAGGFARGTDRHGGAAGGSYASGGQAPNGTTAGTGNAGGGSPTGRAAADPASAGQPQALASSGAPASAGGSPGQAAAGGSSGPAGSGGSSGRAKSGGSRSRGSASGSSASAELFGASVEFGERGDAADPAGEAGEGGGGAGTSGRKGGGGYDDRIKYAVPVPAVLSRGHLWVRGRWVLLPRGDGLNRTLSEEVNAALADRGAPPAGFRWAPEVRLRVRPDGAADVPAVRAALDAAGVPVTVTDAPVAASERRGRRR